MIVMGGNLEQQAQQFLEGIFGKGHKYIVEDGDYGRWMNIAIHGADEYYDVSELHIEIAEHDPLRLKIIRVETFFQILGDDVPDDDWEKTFDCDWQKIYDELNQSLRADEDSELDWELVHMENGLLMIDITSFDGLYEENIPTLGAIKDVVKTMKQVVDSHKKKTAKKGS